MGNREVCDREIMDKCLRSTSGTYKSLDDKIDVKQGDYYDSIIPQILDVLVSRMDLRINTSCLFGDNCDGGPSKEVHDALQKLYNWACELSTDNIYTAINSKISTRSVSVCGAQMTNLPFRVNVTPGKESVAVQWDLQDVIGRIPEDASVSDIRVKIAGESNESVSSTKIADSNSAISSIQVSPDRFPLTIDATVSVRTQCGTVEVYAKRPVYPTAGQNVTNCEVRDFGSNQSGKQSMTQYYQDIEAKLSFILSQIESQDLLQIGDCEHFSYPREGLKNAVIVHANQICKNTSRLEKIGDEKVTYKSCASADCEEEIGIKTLQETLDAMQNQICELVRSNESLEDRLSEAELKLRQCCEN